MNLKVFEKMDVEDLREIMLVTIDSEIEEEEGLQQSDYNLLKFSDVYDVKRVLGVGSYGVVAEVIEISTSRNLAIKICQYNKAEPSPSALALEREYKMLTQLSHPNIIHVYQHEQKFFNYYIMELEMGAETLD